MLDTSFAESTGGRRARAGSQVAPPKRTTVAAEADDLAVLKHEARRRAISFAALLGEVVQKEAAAIRAARRPRIGVVDRPVGIAQAMEDASEDPGATGFRSA